MHFMSSTSPPHIRHQNTKQNRKHHIEENHLGQFHLSSRWRSRGPENAVWLRRFCLLRLSQVSSLAPRSVTPVCREIFDLPQACFLTANHIFLVLSQINKDLLYRWMKNCGLEFTESSSPKWPLPKGLFKGKFDMKLFLPYMLTFVPNPCVRQTFVYLEWIAFLCIHNGQLFDSRIHFLSSGSRHKAVQ